MKYIKGNLDKYEVARQVNGVLVEFLKTSRYFKTPRNHRKKTRLSVPAGQSTYDHNINNEESDSEDVDNPAKIENVEVTPPPVKKPKKLNENTNSKSALKIKKDDYVLIQYENGKFPG